MIAKRQQKSVGEFMGDIITRLKEEGRTRTAETYAATLSSFRTFLAATRRNAPERLTFKRFTPELMEDYQKWMRDRGLTANTMSFYFRNLRAAYNRAKEADTVRSHSRNPFRNVYTGIGKTVKRAVSLDIIRRIKRLDLSDTPAHEYARDIFMLSFYLRGMSFIDMAFLRYSDLRNGYITYRRRKTGQPLIIKWTPEMQSIVDKYPNYDTSYLLPILHNQGINELCAYRNASYNINHNLKKIGQRLGLDKPLTLYVARHSWASAALSKGIPVNVISEGMGHSSEMTTRIYLASLDTSQVDRANAIIIKSL